MIRGLRRPELLRRLRRTRRTPERMEELNALIRRRDHINAMLATHGWKVFITELDARRQRASERLWNPTVSNDEIAKERPLFLASTLIRTLVEQVVADGNEAEAELKLYKEERQDA